MLGRCPKCHARAWSDPIFHEDPMSGEDDRFEYRCLNCGCVVRVPIADREATTT